MKHFTILIILFCTNFLFAQTSVKSVTQITNLNDGEYYYPGFSNDGSKIFFTTVNYKGIYYYDLNQKQIKVVTR